MSRKIEDGKTAKQRYEENKTTLKVFVSIEKAQDIKDCAALAGLSITQYLLMCHENYQHGKVNNN